MEPVSIARGTSPLVLAMPHTGTWLPDEIMASLNKTGQALEDTDWHIDRLYAELIPDATVIRANFHRYVIDANRDPNGRSLYPGQNTTSLCPISDFDGLPIYREGQEPGQRDIQSRLEAFHKPYHAAIASELERTKSAHGMAVLYDCHSIRSRIPYLFEGVLPDFNIGTNGGVTCSAQLESAVLNICGAEPGYSTVLNGRFKGGWTTRHYGRPNESLHAIQMELAQSTYLETESLPFTYDKAKAQRLQRPLKRILETIIATTTQ